MASEKKMPGLAILIGKAKHSEPDEDQAGGASDEDVDNSGDGECPVDVDSALFEALPDASDEQRAALYRAIKLAKG
jgi:hypothetical protein